MNARKKKDKNTAHCRFVSSGVYCRAVLWKLTDISGETRRLHLQSPRITKVTNQRKASRYAKSASLRLIFTSVADSQLEFCKYRFVACSEDPAASVFSPEASFETMTSYQTTRRHISYDNPLRKHTLLIS
jgi:hypothetical protein